MPDRHDKAVSRVISVRVRTETFGKLEELIANSPLPHDTVGGYLCWLIETQALRKR